MQPAVGSSGSIVDRVLGVIQLRKPVFEEIEHDTNATGQALVVVVVAAIASAIGGIGGDPNQAGWFWQAILSVLGWIVFSIVAFYVGTTFFRTPQTDVSLGQVLRMVGFAQAPKIIGALGFIPVLGWIAGVIAWILFLVVAVHALAAAFDTTIDRGALIGVVAIAAWALIGFAVAAVFGLAALFLSLLF